LVAEPLSWVITIIWVGIGFAIYRLYTFRREIEHYAPIVTSEGDLARKHFRILIPYTPENPDRLIKYAIRVAKENDGEVNVLRVITVPQQTPLSAGIAYGERARKSFESLEEMLDKENIPNHYLVRISHDTSEAVLATVEEQRIDLLITDFESLKSNKKLQTLLTCDVLAIRTTGADEDLQFEVTSNDLLPVTERLSISREEEPVGIDNETKAEKNKKNIIVLYDADGEHSDTVLKATSWLEHSGKFKVHVLSIKKRENNNEQNHPNGAVQLESIQREQFLTQVGVEFNEVYLSKETENNSEKLARLIFSAVNASQPDLVILGANIGKFSLFSNPHLHSLLEQLECPVIVARSFTIPGMHYIKLWLMKIIRR
jgi:nucleotide-binding universal stress UspA family protein